MISRIDFIVWVIKWNWLLMLVSIVGLVASLMIDYTLYIAVFLLLLMISLIFELVRSIICDRVRCPY